LGQVIVFAGLFREAGDAASVNSTAPAGIGDAQIRRERIVVVGYSCDLQHRLVAAICDRWI